MERYIRKINDKLLAENNPQKAKKVKVTYQAVGGTVLAVGLGGFLSLFISFMVLFFKFKTDDAFTCWLIAIPFLLMIVAGSLLARIGDALIPINSESENNKTEDKVAAKAENNNVNNKTEVKKDSNNNVKK